MPVAQTVELRRRALVLAREGLPRVARPRSNGCEWPVIRSVLVGGHNGARMARVQHLHLRNLKGYVGAARYSGRWRLPGRRRRDEFTFRRAE
jgi:hypothetical protein